MNNIGRGQRFEAMRDNMAARAQNASQVAMQYTSDAIPNTYALNRNYQAYEIESQAAQSGGIYAGVDFTLFNEATVRRLITEEPDLMPEYSSANVKYDPAVDYEWGKSKITEAITSGILRGVSTKKLGVELQQTIIGMSRTSAMRAARTAMTSAQNAGRLDTINYGAEHFGLDSVKIWISQSDGRVRDSHVQLNGVMVARKAKFPNGLMYPGDRSGAPAEVYNCRCSLGSVLPEMLEDYTGSGIFSTGHTVESYNDWLENKAEKMASKAEGWPEEKPIVHSTEEKEEIIRYAAEKGIEITMSNANGFTGDIDLLKEQIDILSDMSKKYPVKKKLKIAFDVHDIGTLASTNNDCIRFNNAVLRNRNATEKYLNIMHAAGIRQFASKTIEGVGMHEWMHRYEREHGIHGIAIAKQAYYNIYGEMPSYDDITKYLTENVSSYAAYRDCTDKHRPQKDSQYKEVTPEIIAMNEANPNEFTMEFNRLLLERGV